MSERPSSKSAFASALAAAALEIGALRLQPDNPFTWASGYRMPIYNDNRLFLFHPRHRDLILNAFVHILEEEGIDPDIVSGIPTAGIPWGMSLADRLNKPFIYVRSESKDHGKKKKVEGLDDLQRLKGARVLVTEDLVSTGKSSMESIQQLLDLGADVPACLSIFSYALPKAAALFADAGIPQLNILDFPSLLDSLRKNGPFSQDQLNMLASWNADPFAWGENNGFPKV